MKTGVLLLLLLAAVASCDCGGGDTSTGSGSEDDADDDTSSDDDDLTDDDVDDDTTIDDDYSSDDDTSPDDDTTPDDDIDDDNLAKDCWQPDLPPEDGFEWIVSTAAELIDSDGTVVDFVFDGEVPTVFWLQYPTTSHRDLFRARLEQPPNGAWNVDLLNEDNSWISTMDANVAPDGRIEAAFGSCTLWTDDYLCVCEVDLGGIHDCRGLPWADSGSFVSLRHTPDGRAGILFWDFGLHPWYTEETSPGVWELGTILADSGYNTGDLAIGPDGVAHFTWPVYLLMHYYGGVNETWSADVLPIDTNLNGLGNIAISADNELYIATSLWEDDRETMGVLHRLGWSQWDFLPVNEPYNNSGNGNRVELDTDSRLNQAYSFHTAGTRSTLCWARQEGSLWRKEQIDIADAPAIEIVSVHEIAISPNGTVGILYEWWDWTGNKDDKFLKVALRVPVEE